MWKKGIFNVSNFFFTIHSEGRKVFIENGNKKVGKKNLNFIFYGALSMLKRKANIIIKSFAISICISKDFLGIASTLKLFKTPKNDFRDGNLISFHVKIE